MCMGCNGYSGILCQLAGKVAIATIAVACVEKGRRTMLCFVVHMRPCSLLRFSSCARSPLGYCIGQGAGIHPKQSDIPEDP